LLSARRISKSYGSRSVLLDVDLVVPRRARIALIGPNGIGKSTLLRILAGLDEPDLGTVTAPGLVGYLPQEAEAEPGETVRDYLARRTGVAAAEEELARREEALPDGIDDHAAALERFLALGGDDLGARARGVCGMLGLHADLERTVDSLSGGQRARAALAAILLARFDVFLLDEPTNDLDFRGLELLERFVRETRAAVVVVSHDRAFLERVTTDVLEFEAETGRPTQYAGGYGEFERMRAAARERQGAAYERYRAEKGRFTELLSDRRTQARSGGTGLGNKTGGADRRGTHALMTKVRQAERRLERLEDPGKPWTPWELRLEFRATTRSGDLVLELDGAVVERGTFRLGPLDLDVRSGDRVAIVGPNGTGKTTLVEALLGRLALAAGARRLGTGVELGLIDQDRARFDGGERLLDAFVRESGFPAEEARSLLAKLALGADDVLRTGASLSPGERTRADLALLQARGVNCLVLDEPTNHLDLEAIEQLEGALANFDGTLLVVSHDRRFLEGIAPSKIVELT
jgi:ATPase subunit of ABC transporter with duplicated ATPase domains